MASANQTRPHCVNEMGKTHSKPLVARHGRGTAWAQHVHGMLCVNRPLAILRRRLKRLRTYIPEHYYKNHPQEGHHIFPNIYRFFITKFQVLP